MNRSAFPMMPVTLCATFLVASLTVACQKDAPSASDPTTPVSPAAEENAPADDTPQVVFEPAYPEEVSSETLDESDVAQQAQGHSHGDGEHSHGNEDAHEEGHSHDSEDGSDHDHGG